MILKKLSLVISVTLPLFLFSQERWSLEQCVLYAQQNNLTLKSAAYTLEDAELNLRQAKHARFPTLNFSTGYNMSFGRNVDPTTNDFETQNIGANNFNFSSGITLYNGGFISNSIRQGDLIMQEADLRVQQFSNDIALDVARAYLQVLFADERLDQANFQLDISRQQLERMLTLIEAGQNPISDRYELDAQVARDEQALITAQNNVEINLLNLKLLLELDPIFDLQVVKPEIEIPQSPDIDQLTFEIVYAKTLSTQPAFKADDLALQISELGVKLAQANYYPRLSFGASVGSNYSTLGKTVTGFNTFRVPFEVFQVGEPDPIVFELEQTAPNLDDNPYFDQINENLGYGFGFSLNVPIYNNYSSKTSVERARVQVLRDKNQNDINKQTWKSNIQLVIADARAAKEQLEAANKTLESLQASYDNISKQLELNAATTYDLTDARNRLDSGLLDALIAKYDYIFKLKAVDYYLGNEITLD